MIKSQKEEAAYFLCESIDERKYNKNVTYIEAFNYVSTQWNELLTNEENLELFIQYYNLDDLPLYKEFINNLKDELILIKKSFSLSKIINSISRKKVIKNSISILFVCTFVYLFFNNEQAQLFACLGFLSMFACGVILFLLALLLQMIGVSDYIFKNYPSLTILFSIMFFIIVWVMAILNHIK